MKIEDYKIGCIYRVKDHGRFFCEYFSLMSLPMLNLPYENYTLNILYDKGTAVFGATKQFLEEGIEAT
jgi:hypothetical protein